MFTFTRKERRALLLLAWTIIILMGMRSWWSQVHVPLQWIPAPVDDPSAPRASRLPDGGGGVPVPKESDILDSDLSGLDGHEAQSKGHQIQEVEPFDPNVADVEQMKAAGLPGKVAYTIRRYREKGGRFYRKTDLLKIYDMTDAIYARVEHLLLLPEEKVLPDRPQVRITININQADQEEWTYLPGIGKGYAKRICGFRDALGGFTSLQQVGETFGLPDSTFQRILPHLHLGEFQPGVLINSWDAAQLAAHPYIHPKEARILVNYRSQHGAYQSETDIRRALIMMDSTRLNRLLPYLNFKIDGS